MKRKKYITLLRYLPPFIVSVFVAAALIACPKEAANGVKNGLSLLGSNIIPSLFPFMVLSSYISGSPLTDYITRITEKICIKLFKTNGYALMSVFLGLLGGYPIGPKTVAEFHESGKLSKNEAQRLFWWCVNPSPAFVITAVGTFMLSDYKSGIILYGSTLLSTLTTGIAMRFFGSSEKLSPMQKSKNQTGFVEAVASGSEAMLSVCGWVLTFSEISALVDITVTDKSTAFLIKSALEVTTGCLGAAEHNASLPIISATLGFGGLAVIFQISKYLKICHIDMKIFLCSRLFCGALNAFFCSQLLRIFPISTEAFKTVTVAETVFPLSHSITATVILVIMCTVLILEVDNRKKVC